MELIREIIVPTSNSYKLNLPDKWIEKKVEVMLAFETEKISTNVSDEKIKKLNESLWDLQIDLSNFKFDRDKANNSNE